MPINMYKVLFLGAKIAYFNKSIERKVALLAYNTSCIPQMGICK